MKILGALALVVFLATHTAAQSIAQPDSITVSTVLDVLNETIEIPLDGKTSATFSMTGSSSPVLTLNAGVSADNGASYHETNVRFITPAGELLDTLTNPSTNGLYGIIIPSGGTHARIRVSAYTSGSVTGSLSASSAQNTAPLTYNGSTIPTNFGFQLFGGKDGTTARLSTITTNGALHFNPRNAAGTEIATAGNPFRIDPTGTTIQPVSISQTTTNNDVDVITSVVPAGLAAVVTGQQAVTASAVALPSNAGRLVCVKVLAAGTQNVYFGPSGVTTGTGMELVPGEGMCRPLDNSNRLFVIAGSTGSTVAFEVY